MCIYIIYIDQKQKFPKYYVSPNYAVIYYLLYIVVAFDFIINRFIFLTRKSSWRGNMYHSE